MGRYDMMLSGEYSQPFMPLNINTTGVRNARCLLIFAMVLGSMLWRNGQRRLHVANGMLEMGTWSWRRM